MIKGSHIKADGTLSYQKLMTAWSRPEGQPLRLGKFLDPQDPVKYDFSLCHLGMADQCGFNRAQGDSECPLRGLCHPGKNLKSKSSNLESSSRSG